MDETCANFGQNLSLFLIFVVEVEQVGVSGAQLEISVHRTAIDVAINTFLPSKQRPGWCLNKDTPLSSIQLFSNY
jgi:hypothetical protein